MKFKIYFKISQVLASFVLDGINVILWQIKRFEGQKF